MGESISIFYMIVAEVDQGIKVGEGVRIVGTRDHHHMRKEILLLIAKIRLYSLTHLSPNVQETESNLLFYI